MCTKGNGRTVVLNMSNTSPVQSKWRENGGIRCRSSSSRAARESIYLLSTNKSDFPLPHCIVRLVGKRCIETRIEAGGVFTVDKEVVLQRVSGVSVFTGNRTGKFAAFGLHPSGTPAFCLVNVPIVKIDR